MINNYLSTLGQFDLAILCYGGFLVAAHLILLWPHTRFFYFRAAARRWQQVLSAMSEILPLLGLLGTLGAMLGTFKTIGASGSEQNLKEIVAQFSPALTTTISGIVMLIPNLLLNVFLQARVQGAANDGTGSEDDAGTDPTGGTDED